MTHEDKPKFLQLLATLFGAHNKPMSDGVIAGYWKGLEKMQLDTFERCCDEAIDKLARAERGVSKVPTVSELWDIKRNLRMLPRSDVPEKPYAGDEWEIAANLLLLAKIRKNNYHETGIDYAPDCYGYPAKQGPQTIAIAAILSKWKSAWARDMREDRAEGGNRDGKPDWIECMASADAEVRRYLASMRIAA